MDINISTEADVTNVKVSGHLNTSTAPELEKALSALEPAPANLVVDLTDLEYLSSAGLRVLLGAKKTLDATGGSFCVTNPCDDVREVFEITGLLEIFNVR